MHLVIIGNGITGVTCALTVRRLHPDARITLVSDESPYHISRPALMYTYMGHIRPQDLKPYGDWFWPENSLELVQATATHIEAEHHLVHLSTGAPLAYDKLLVATGSVSRFERWPGQELQGVQGLYGLQDLERMHRETHGVGQAVVVGGGLIGVELAEMLHSRGIAVTMLVRDTHYWGSVLPPEEAALVNRQLQAHHIHMHYSTELAEILGDSAGRVRAVRTTDGREIACQWVGLATGVTPNLSLAQASGLETARGILVNEHLQTNQPDVYAAGDCAQHRQTGLGQVPVEQLWYTGRQQGETVAYAICGQPQAYQRGVWFNSAKFFQLEYQTYGQVPARTPSGTHSFCWQHPNGQLLLRINFWADDNHAVTGMNTLGIRQRHDVWDQWLRQGTPVTQVLAELGAANFDPEFFQQHEAAIVGQFNEQFPQHPVALKRRKGLFSFGA
ncbi:Pyridine nucleotide-disulphide oxidoreductase [Hymenobacter gelipurpurascens]|uniref:Pyridine nucleotide-disulphide oxidoreductase n=1 Tax=Hymenobacter gelipurpurascens TaxID=89968 RepID=A0A212TES3_9BACT|nr:FAD/NAD(P)-binding oxidoreductase [Hymenobacter gelipurpurascens]SNC64529.1 Pyridine nucleotide-disulphide oxidoreductase [Hymenobacter gelipurpurascens]